MYDAQVNISIYYIIFTPIKMRNSKWSLDWTCFLLLTLIKINMCNMCIHCIVPIWIVYDTQYIMMRTAMHLTSHDQFTCVFIDCSDHIVRPVSVCRALALCILQGSVQLPLQQQKFVFISVEKCVCVCVVYCINMARVYSLSMSSRYLLVLPLFLTFQRMISICHIFISRVFLLYMDFIQPAEEREREKKPPALQNYRFGANMYYTNRCVLLSKSLCILLYGISIDANLLAKVLWPNRWYDTYAIYVLTFI